MLKELIKFQRYSKATCVVINQDDDFTELSPVVIMKAGVKDDFLLAGRPPFADVIDQKCETNELCFFVITEIDKEPIESQNRYVGLVKDREFNGYELPDNCIIIFTVKDKKSLKKISPDLFHFAVVCF